MDNIYDDSLDLGVAVKEESTLSSVKSKKKKRRRKRSGSTSSIDVLPLPTADDAADNNDTDKQSSSSTKKKKRKKKKKRTNDDSIEDTQEGASIDKSIQTTTSIAKQAPLKGNFIKERSNLPVYQHREEMCNLVSKNDVVLVVAETVSWLLSALI